MSRSTPKHLESAPRDHGNRELTEHGNRELKDHGNRELKEHGLQLKINQQAQRVHALEGQTTLLQQVFIICPSCALWQ